MKTISTVLSVALIAVLVWYGYSFSMTEDGFILQGYLGAALPAVFGALLYAHGRIGAQS